jgi:hypothetical protein
LASLIRRWAHECRPVLREIVVKKMASLQNLLDNELKLGDELLKDDATRDAAGTIMAKINDVHAKLERIKKGGALQGSDHPMSQYATEHGKQMHDDYASRYKCNVYDQPYPDADGRPDCVVLGSTCYVYEFKPETPGQRAKGNKQLDRYVPAVTRFYQRRINAKDGDDSTLQGRITSEVERQCLKGGAVTFDRDVIFYPLCERKFECTR